MWFLLLSENVSIFHKCAIAYSSFLVKQHSPPAIYLSSEFRNTISSLISAWSFDLYWPCKDYIYFNVCKIDFIIWHRNEGLLCYTSVNTMLTSKQCVLTTYSNFETHIMPLLQVYIGAWAKIETVIENQVCKIVIIVFKNFPCTYCLLQGNCAICTKF